MAASAGGVFDAGSHGVSLTRVDAAGTRCSRSSKGAGVSPPKPLLIAAPVEVGEYPVLVFMHGYLAANSFYSQLFEHVASHGFVVVAPQMYTISGPDCTDEINSAAAVIDWLAGGGLSSALPTTGVRPDLTKGVSVAGHSRGGKVAFALALGHAKLPLPLTALVAVDPVDGTGAGKQTPPPILTGEPRSLVTAPAMVIGTGLGEMPRGPLLPPCAPRGVSHAAFYHECGGAAPAACHLVARDYGHTDMMDDVTPGARGLATRALCKSGGARAPMRRFVSGATVAFMRKWAVGGGGDGAALDGIRARPETAPVVLSVVEFLDEIVD